MVLAGMALLLAISASPIQADDATSEGSAPQVFMDGKHRFDLSLNQLDTGEGDFMVLLPGYTLTVGTSLRFNVTASLLTESNETDFGDSLLVVQYDPSDQLRASPWIPDTLGINATIRAPTGNADKGFGVDAWQINVGAGWGFDFYRNLWLIPAGYYETTFGEEKDELYDEEMGVNVSFVWLFHNGIWLGYRPNIARNFQLDEWADDHTFVAGKLFRNGFGLGFEYGRRDRIDPTASRDDYTALMNFYYVFGQVD